MSGTQTTKKESDGGTPAVQSKNPPSLKTPQQIIYVKAGAEKKSFGIHKELACFHSPYIKAAFSGNFKEAKVGELVLDSVDSDVFGLFVHWMYTQKIDQTICVDETLTKAEKFLHCLPTAHQLVDLWLFAEYLQVPKLQNHVIDLVLQRRKTYHNVAFPVYQRVYEKTSCGSILRKFFVDILCWSNVRAITIAGRRECLPAEMIFDLFLAERTVKMEPNTPNPTWDTKNYHVSENHK